MLDDISNPVLVLDRKYCQFHMSKYMPSIKLGEIDVIVIFRFHPLAIAHPQATFVLAVVDHPGIVKLCHGHCSPPGPMASKLTVTSDDNAVGMSASTIKNDAAQL